jgi:hypothetical protein
MKIIVNTEIIETEMIFDGDAYKVWEYTNDNKEQEIAIMDSTGYDVSLKSAVLDHGEVLNQAMILSPDPEEYVHQQFINFKK